MSSLIFCANMIRAKPNQHKCKGSIQVREDTRPLQPFTAAPKLKVVLKRRQIIGVHLLLANLYNAVLTKHLFIITKAIRLIEL